jgi:hypothetical protein
MKRDGATVGFFAITSTGVCLFFSLSPKNPGKS